ncbi:hypothetical protein CEXT_364781 [Caerostris extrusa]|uniref:Uncharacterized protein n=1 Tax=Caerostris extrusa TaxID=172846 RepID=A0AAV4XC39_CAEEX|nr:hypothetical protein CEXT_364781 [Caerostris extrusa]
MEHNSFHSSIADDSDFLFPLIRNKERIHLSTKRNHFQSGSRLDATMGRDESSDQHPDSDRSAGLLTISSLSNAISPPRILSLIPPPFFSCPFSPFANDVH